jgi:hypothetical protein
LRGGPNPPRSAGFVPRFLYFRLKIVVAGKAQKWRNIVEHIFVAAIVPSQFLGKLWRRVFQQRDGNFASWLRLRAPSHSLVGNYRDVDFIVTVFSLASGLIFGVGEVSLPVCFELLG